jgi:F-type H+-transporting ATPase subunit delta
VRAGTEKADSQYAEAIFEIASKTPDLLEKIADELNAVNQVIKQAPDLQLIFGHPSIANEKKKVFLSSIFEGKVSDLTFRLLGLLTDKRRLKLLPQIEQQYRIRLNAAEQIVTARLIGSYPLSESDVANVKARLTEHLGKRLELEMSVDQSLIGGFILRLGDQVIDGSLKGKLRAIEKTLMAV